MKFKKIVNVILSSTMLLSFATTTFAENNDVNFTEITDENYQYESRTPFVLAATGENGNINISCSSLEFFGDLSSTNKINIWSGTIKENGLKMENDSSVILNSFKDNLNNYKYVNLNDVYVSQVKRVENDPVKCNIYSNSSSEIELHSVIYSNDRIDLSAQNINANETSEPYLYSENGDININCENFNFSGIIYAPNGNVNISANNTNIHGFIISNNISLNASKIVIKENCELYTKYENLDIEEQKNTDQLLEEYFDAVDDLNDAVENDNVDSEEYQEIENKYDELHEQIEDKDMFLSEEEVKDFFEQQYDENKPEQEENSQTVTAKTTLKKAAKFKPCDDIENLYDVIRRQGTYTYKKKSYPYYSMVVSDKANKRKLDIMWNNNVTVTGEIIDKSAANRYLNKAYQITFCKGAGAAISSLGTPLIGATAAAALSKIYPFGKPTAADLVVKGRALHTVDSIQVNSRMRYYWVKYDKKWQFSYSCNSAIWRMRHTFYKYNHKKHCYEYKTQPEKIVLKGTFYDPSVAVKTIVDYKKLYGKNANNGINPLGWNKTGDLIIKKKKKKKIPYDTPFFRNTIQLI